MAPGEFTNEDGSKSVKRIVINTDPWSGVRGMALTFTVEESGCMWLGSDFILRPLGRPVLIPFPQSTGRCNFDPATGLPVSQGGVSPGGIVVYADRQEGAWAGLVSRCINSGNSEEEEVQMRGTPSFERHVLIAQDIPEPVDVKKPSRAESGAGNAEARHRRIVAVPANYPVGGEAQKSAQGKPDITYIDFKREWNKQRLLHELDRSIPDPGTVPDQQTFERLLREGKIRIEK